MRKKRSDKLNVSQLFVLKNSNSPKIFQKNSNGSFSQAVTGFLIGSEDNANSWPELSAGSKFLKYRDNNTCANSNYQKAVNVTNLSENSQSQKIVSFNANLQKGNEESRSALASGNSFPTLDGVKSRKSKSSRSHVGLPESQENSILVKPRNLVKQIKPKKNDPISIDIESAIELGQCRKKKQLKRLDQKWPKKVNVISCSGNALDASNPVRKKGKVRLNKKKKLSSLRKLIEKMRQRSSNERDIEGALCKRFDGISLTKEHLDKIAKAKLHTSKFREYCTNFATRELVESVKELVITVRGFQNRMFKKDEVKARAKKRYAVGFHECWKLLRANSFKLIVMATNIERNEALLQKINEFVIESTRQGVPVIFAGTCTDLSFWLFKKNRTCIVGIINYDGANESYNKMMSIFERDKAEYEVKLGQIIEDEMNSVDNVAEELRSQMLHKLTAN